MRFLTQKSLHRRTFLRGLFGTIALPYLDAMERLAGSSTKGGGAQRSRESGRLHRFGATGAAGPMRGVVQVPVGAQGTRT
jgi:hypothetical protein